MLAFSKALRTGPALFAGVGRTGRYWLGIGAFALGIASISLVTSLEIRALLHALYDADRDVRLAQLSNGRLLKDQLDEETAVRGYVSSDRREFLQPYLPAERQFASDAVRLEGTLPQSSRTGRDALHRLVGLHETWIARVAAPILAGGPAAYSIRRARLGKEIVDAMRASSRSIDVELEREAARQSEAADANFNRIALTSTIALVLVGSGILVLLIRQSRLQSDLRIGRETVGLLQRGFVNRLDTLPGTDIGTAYVSATRGALVGGDFFDVHRVDDRFGYVLIADVSGKGIEAAIDTAFIKYVIRGLVASERRDPSVLLAKLEELLDGHLSTPDNFVVLFLAIVDYTTLTLEYSSAGHGGAFLEHERTITQLAPTGRIVFPTLARLGMQADFGSRRLQLRSGDVLVLATDGLTEARNPGHEMLTDEGAMRWIAEIPPTESAQEAADSLVRRVRRYVEGELRDDLALLFIRFD